MIQTHALRFGYRQSHPATLDFSPAAGEFWAVLGCNGVGKTALLKTLAGLLPPQAGEVLLGDKALAQWPLQTRAQRIAVLLQEEALQFSGTVCEYVALARFPWGGMADPARIGAALAAMDVMHLATRRLSLLSGGERQRVRLAQLLAQDSGVLLLDEPLQHLDWCQQQRVLQRLQQAAHSEGRCVVAVLHEVHWVSSWCDKAVLLYPDRVEQGDVAVCLQTQVLQQLYGCDKTINYFA